MSKIQYNPEVGYLSNLRCDSTKTSFWGAFTAHNDSIKTRCSWYDHTSKFILAYGKRLEDRVYRVIFLDWKHRIVHSRAANDEEKKWLNGGKHHSFYIGYPENPEGEYQMKVGKVVNGNSDKYFYRPYSSKKCTIVNFGTDQEVCRVKYMPICRHYGNPKWKVRDMGKFELLEFKLNLGLSIDEMISHLDQTKMFI